MSSSVETYAVAEVEAPLAAVKRLTGALVITGLVSVTLGILMGPLQALNYANYNAYTFIQPVVGSYYLGLTLHGVLNAFAFTTFFMCGLMLYLTARELDVAPNLGFGWFGYAIMLLGLLLAAGAILSNTSTVLYTFYAPMQASWAFYLGLGLIFLASWVFVYEVFRMVHVWRVAHPGAITPLASWMSLITLGMWFIASLGVVAEVVIYLLPWSLGIRAGVDPLVTRSLFWLTGHPIVYFWLMPAYISWYTLVPRQAGGSLVSDPLARLAFILLMLFSLPVGVHHQLQDAGIPTVIRAIVILLTFMVIFPSLVTAFTVGASLERAGRNRGGRGALGWIWALPWKDPSFSAQGFAMLIFIMGGATGMVNASWILNVTIHNTSWVPGHFHATLASASALTFLGISYWLLPHLTGKPLFAPRLALVGNWFWFIGMLVFSNSMMAAGLMGVPRRAWLAVMLPGSYGLVYSKVLFLLITIGIGGVLLGIAVILIFISIWGTILRSGRKRIETEIPFSDRMISPAGVRIARIADHYYWWLFGGLLLVVAVYLPLLIHLLAQYTPLPGLRRW